MHRQWVVLDDNASSVNSPFQRNSMLWKVAADAAKNETAGTSLVSSFDGTNVVIHQPSHEHPRLSIKLSTWETAAQCSIVEFVDSVNSLLPSECSVSEFPVALLVDDLDSPNGLHHQPQNTTLILAWERKILDKLLHPGEKRHSLVVQDRLSYPSLLAWLKFEQNTVLTALSKVAALTSVPGISDWKYGYLCFDGSRESSRHIFLLNNGLCCFHDPIVDAGISLKGLRLYAFPAEVTGPLCLYLYVIRPIACKLLKMMGCDHASYHSHVWAHVKPNCGRKKAWTWTGPQVSASIKASTGEAFGIELTPYLINKLLSDLFKTNLMDTLQFSNDESPVDRQAQHRRHTSVQHYGWVSNHFPPLKNLRLHHPLKHLAASEVWHALLRLGPVCAAWSEMAIASPLVAVCMRRKKAADTALEMVLREYLVSGATAETALKDLPFLARQPVSRLIAVPNATLKTLSR